MNIREIINPYEVRQASIYGRWQANSSAAFGAASLTMSVFSPELRFYALLFSMIGLSLSHYSRVFLYYRAAWRGKIYSTVGAAFSFAVILGYATGFLT